MKILFINGLHPKPNNKMSGIFITNRLKYLKNFSKIEYYSISPIMKDSISLKFLRKIMNRPLNIIYPSKITVENVEFNFININTNIFTRIFYNFPRMAAKSILKIINIKEYDLIHAHWIYPHGYIAKIISEKYKIPYIVTAHGSDIHFFPQKDFNVKKFTIETLENSTKNIFVSTSLLEKAKKFGFSGKNSVVIPNGVDLSKFKILNREKIKKEIGLDEKVVGFAGGLSFVKRADKLPEIFNIINSKLKKISFLLIGEGKYKEKIINETKNLDVKIMGYINPEKMPYYLNAMDIMILPSRNEGFGAVLIEAMACGTYVIGSSNGGIPEVIKSYGSIINEGGNFEKRIADEVVRVLKEGYDREVLKNYAKNYDWNLIIEKEVKIYKEILGDKKC
ncbi:hypothetical protein XO12_05770 [Marinitoga sp. 1154]|uniref:glycosyltransferase n=1 Tax=Marinitoga sp. 1154 TaxID=1643335 RepID=UPI0015869296|nr:glycosyltransferase [Marinitoga sp. 1154]NUU99625.1 hypothetical protein [Marinitoga sp. 1154]